jgi:hypothetical protein
LNPSAVSSCFKPLKYCVDSFSKKFDYIDCKIMVFEVKKRAYFLHLAKHHGIGELSIIPNRDDIL